MRHIRERCGDPRCLLAVGNWHFEATLRRSVTIILRHIVYLTTDRRAWYPKRNGVALLLGTVDDLTRGTRTATRLRSTP
jgi:hypothetical protein